jgi:hypothetical protein
LYVLFGGRRRLGEALARGLIYAVEGEEMIDERREELQKREFAK